MRSAGVLRLPVAAVVLSCSTVGQALAQSDPDSAGRARRRTPVVEVYQTWKDSVVCLTGPAVKSDGPSIEEFFKSDNQQQVSRSLGSGFIVHRSGYVLTNAHAVERVIAPEVTFDVRARRYPAELIGLAPQRDLALLKIDAGRPLKPVRLAQSRDLMIGETVIVIGNPHGLIRTCTAGVLSATDRRAQPSSQPGMTLGGLLQSDAALSPGSSGGPWFNVLGAVIGISTMAKAGPQRIGFAIPAATIRSVLPELLDVERRYGITTGLAVYAQGPCRVTEVAAGSPAAAAGVSPGEVIVQLDAARIATAADFQLALVGRKPGEKLKLKLLDGGRPRDVWVVLGRRRKPDAAAMLKRKLGLAAVPLDATKARAMALRVNSGVVITAAAAELYKPLKRPPLPGDVLGRINGIRPRDLDHVGLLLQRLEPPQPAHIVLLRLRGDVATRIDLQVVPRE